MYICIYVYMYIYMYICICICIYIYISYARSRFADGGRIHPGGPQAHLRLGCEVEDRGVKPGSLDPVIQCWIAAVFGNIWPCF